MKHYLQKELYQLIKEDEKIFDFIQEGSLDGLWYWDLEKPENEWMNAKFWQVLGYDPSKMPHKSSAWQDIINQDDLKLALDNFHKHVADPKHPYDQEVRYKHKNGSTVWVRCRGLVIRNEEGKAVRMLGAHQDITALKESKLILDEIIDQSPFAMWISDEKGLIQRINSLQQKLIGMPEEDIVGKYNVLEDKIAEKAGIMPQIKSVFEEGKTINFTLEWDGKKMPGDNYKNANKVTGRTTMFPVFNREGKLTNVVAQWVDIAKEAETEKKIKESEEKFRLLSENSSDAIWTMDLKLNFTYVSPAIKQLLDYEPEKFMGTNLSSYCTRKEFFNMARKAIFSIKNFTTKPSVLFESVMLKKDGTEVPVEISGKILSNKKGFPIALQGSTRNISIRKKAQEEILRQRDMFETVINSVPSLIFWKDKELNYLGCNKAFSKYAGLKDPKDIIGKSDYDMVWGSEANNYRVDDLSVIKTSIPKLSYDESVLDHKGNRIQLRTNKLPLKNDKGKTIGLIATTENITEEKKTQKTIKENEDRFRNLFEQSPYGITICQMLRNDQNEIVDYIHVNGNRSVKDQTGFDLNQLIGKKASEIVDSDTFKYLLNLYGSVISTGKTVNYEQYFEVYNRTLEVTAFPLYGDYFIINFINISDRKRAEQKTKESEEKFRELFEQSPLAIQIYNKKGDLIDVNQQTKTLFDINDINEIADYNFWSHPSLTESNKNDLKSGKTIKISTSFEYESLKSNQLISTNKKGIKYIDMFVSPILQENKTQGYIVQIVDITDQTKAKEEILNNEKFISAIANTSPAMIYVYDMETNENVYSNDGVQRLLNYSAVEIQEMGENVLPNLVHPDDFPLVIENHKNIFDAKDEDVLSLEYRMKHRDGIWKFFSSSEKVFLRNEDGSVKHKVGIAYDITEIKAFQKELKNRNEFISMIIDRLPIGFALNDVDTNQVTYINDKFAEIYGWKKEEFPNTVDFFTKVFPDETYRNELMEIIINDMQSGDPKRMNWDNLRITTQSGETRYVNAFNIPLFDQNTMVSTVQDVTHRHHYEEKIKRNEKRLKEAQSISALGNFEHSFENDTLYWSEETFKILGFPYSETPPNYEEFKARLPKSDRIKIEEFVERAFKEGIGYNYTYQYLFPETNDFKYIFVKVEVIKDEKNHPLGIKGTIQDVTKQKQYEEEIEQQNKEYEALNEELTQTNEELTNARDKAEESEKLKTAFLANMSHEIRTPMNGILGFLEILQEPDITDYERDEFLKRIRRSGDRLLNTINDILEFSMIDTGDIRINKQSFNIKDCIDDHLKFFELECIRKGIELKSEIDDHLFGLMMNSDKSKIDSILTNLIKNAIKFTDSGYVSVSCKKHKDHIECVIKDTGKGIPLEKQKIIFERFRQAENTTIKDKEGSGLGLAITKAYIEKLGGEITLESEVNKGSKFCIRLPFAEESE